MAGQAIYDVRLVWHSGYESTVTVRATSTKHARSKAREFALNRTGVPPSRVTVKKVQVL